MTPAKPTAKVKFEVAREDLDILLDDLRALGCREARVVKVSELAFRESIARKCEVPQCGSYGNSFQCPPYTPDKEEVAACIPEAYEVGVVGVLGAPPGEMATPGDGNVMEVMAKAGKWSARLSNIVGKVESRAHELGYYKAMGFNCGACTWCGMWTRKWYNDFASGRDLAACTVIRNHDRTTLCEEADLPPHQSRRPRRGEPSRRRTILRLGSSIARLPRAGTPRLPICPFVGNTYSAVI